jgi:hypothetical protein
MGGCPGIGGCPCMGGIPVGVVGRTPGCVC